MEDLQFPCLSLLFSPTIFNDNNYYTQYNIYSAWLSEIKVYQRVPIEVSKPSF